MIVATSSDAIRSAAEILSPFLPERAWLPHGLIRKPNGDLDKPPREGATTDNPASWFTLAAALEKLTGTNSVAGIGFAVVKRLITLDFDHCRDQITGQLNDDVQAELERCNSFAYVTPSQTGIRIVGLNDAFQPIPGGKRNRWTAGRQKIEIFIGPTNHYNTFTPDLIPGYAIIRDISDVTLDYLQFLDPGRKAPNGAGGESAPTSNPDPQRSIGAIRAALVVIPNNVQDWDEWNRMGMAVWRASGGSGDGLDAWVAWSARNPCNGQKDTCDARWQHYFESPPTKIGYGTLYYEARKHRPLFVPPFDEIPGDGRATDGDLPFEKSVVMPPILDALAFMATFVMPDYLIDGIVQRGRLHALTSPTGHGKTAVALFLACMMAMARNIGAIEVTQGDVLIMGGENPDDLCVRLHAACQAYGIMPGMLPVYIMPGNFPLDPAAAESLKRRINETGRTFSLIIGDSLAAYFPGDDENHNVQMGGYARNWRVLTTCVGRPAVIALAHPVKAAGRDNLLPRGGGAFLAEIDANLTLWAEGDRETTTLHWQGKIRGADFQPVTFGLTPVVMSDKRDAKGRPLVSVVATLQTSEQADDVLKKTISDEDAVLEHLRRSPDIPIRNLAINCGWVSLSGVADKAKAHRTLKRLERIKLAKKWRGKWRITEAGKAELKGEK